MKKEDSKQMTFEQAMKRLEEVLRALEEQTAPLDDMLSLYEEGVALVAKCNDILDKASERVNVVVKKEGSFSEEKFTDTDE